MADDERAPYEDGERSHKGDYGSVERLNGERKREVFIVLFVMLFRFRLLRFRLAFGGD